MGITSVVVVLVLCGLAGVGVYLFTKPKKASPAPVAAPSATPAAGASTASPAGKTEQK